MRSFVLALLIAGCAPSQPAEAPVVPEVEPSTKPPVQDDAIEAPAGDPADPDGAAGLHDPSTEAVDEPDLDARAARVLRILASEELSGIPARPQGIMMSSPAPEGRTAQHIRQVMKSMAPQAKKCFNAELKRKPGISGKVVLELNIEPSGLVSHVTVRRGIDPTLDECLRSAARRLKFDPDAGSAKVVFPFVFAST